VKKLKVKTMNKQINLNQLQEHIKREALKLQEAEIFNNDNNILVLNESEDLSEQEIDEFWSGLKNAFNKTTTDAGNAASSAKQSIKDKVSSAGQAIANKAGQVKDKAVSYGQDVKHAYNTGEHNAAVEKQKAQVLQLKNKMDKLQSQYKKLTGKSYKGGAVANPSSTKQAPVHPRAAAAE